MKKISTVASMLFLLVTVTASAQTTPVKSLEFDIIRTSEQKYKVAIAIMVEPNNCNINVEHINPLYETKFENIDVDMKIFFHSGNTQQMNEIIKTNRWKPTVIQDPLGLYAKHFNIKTYPSIVILDENNNQIYNNYLTDYHHIVSILSKINELAATVTAIETNEYKVTKLITLKKDNEKYTDGQFIQAFFDDNKNDYWLINDKSQSIVVFDASGKYYKEMQLPHKNHFKYYYPTNITWINDSIIYFADGDYLIKMNINAEDTLASFNLKNDVSYRNSEGLFVANNYKYIPKTNNVIFTYTTIGFRKLKYDTPLLLLLDADYNLVQTFAPSPKWMAEYSMAFSILAYTTKIFLNDADDNIYFVIGNTNIVNIFDKNGNHIKDIALDFSLNYKHSYYINVERGENYMNQRNEMNKNISYIDLIRIENNAINVFYSNYDLSDVSNIISVYYYEQFSLDGMRMLANPIQYATNERPIYFKNNKLITHSHNNSINTIKWYEFRK